MRGDIPAVQFTSFSNSSDTLSSTSAYMTATLLHSFQAPRCHTGHSERWHLGENGPGQEADTPAVQFTSFQSFPILCRQYLHTSDMNEWVSFKSFRNDILKEMFWAQFNSWGAPPPCLFTIHTLKHAWQHFYFYNSAMIKTIQYIRSSSDLACFLFFQISLNSFHIDILASKTGVDNWIVRGITKWPQSKKAIMRHTAAPFLLATFKKHPPPFQHMCMWNY